MDRNSGPLMLRLKELVALRKESVDRNRISGHLVGFHSVALRKESVDRNGSLKLLAMHILVALRKESVDRNC